MTGLPSVLSRAYLSWSLAELGAFAEAIGRAEEGVGIAEAADHPFSRIWAYGGIGKLYLDKGDVHRGIPLLERSLEICQDRHISAMFPTAASRLGYAYALSGRVPKGLPLLEQAVEQAAAMRIMATYSRMSVLLSEAYLLAGRVDEATELAIRVLEFSRDHKERGFHAWALRLLGEIAAHRARPEVEQAESYYHAARALADELGMRPLLAHCHRGLGGLYGKIGRPEPARVELSTAIEMYRSMDMTFWLPQAEAALAEVEGR
jgi:tetratricopeptide (TPR) repeat protein